MKVLRLTNVWLRGVVGLVHLRGVEVVERVDHKVICGRLMAECWLVVMVVSKSKLAGVANQHRVSGEGGQSAVVRVSIGLRFVCWWQCG